ncbi:UDP-N-acetylmuramate dehydrogenase [Devosia sp. 1566]|uniref:UDP-N-acetylmuramate dehydrogenase n=1 Tax=Devosia sp. 1566 TaxID=2499144 RepID=UPI0019D1CCCD|nr:UDP-N-acetylmuramate dehydrogenase [Devosia sp. 1566]
MQLIPDFDLRHCNTFGLSAKARFGTTINTPQDIPALLDAAERLDLPLRILGQGSNVVLRPVFEGIVAQMAIKGRQILQDTPEQTIIEAGAGENWHDFVSYTVANGMPGLENLALIPGTVGAAPVQNIGAYGLELADRFASLSAYDTHEQCFVQLGLEDCAFSYRQSLFKREPNRFIVAAVRFALPRPWTPNLRYAGLSELPAEVSPQAVMDRVVELRRSKLPDWTKTGNAGSFFHNPVVDATTVERIRAEHPGAPAYPQPDGRSKLSAGWLIEQSGFKGLRIGGAGVSERHALVVVNHGGATYAVIAEISDRVRTGVEAQFGVILVQEPETI